MMLRGFHLHSSSILCCPSPAISAMQGQSPSGEPLDTGLAPGSLGLPWPRPGPSQVGMEPQGGDAPSGARVCDNCIRKKVKCDLVRPTCSYCSLRGYACNYSSAKRRPGPARGSRRGSRRTPRAHGSPRPPEAVEGSAAESAWSSRSVASSSSHPLAASTEEVAATPVSVVSQQPSTTHSASPQDVRTGASDNLARFNILPQEADHLLQQFLDTIHGSVPIFPPDRFLASARNSEYSSDLVFTVVLLTAKLTGFTFASRGYDLDYRIDRMLGFGSLEQDMCDDSQSLDQFRKACLLAFYEFHQYPGQQAWMRVGRLTRRAYWRGLDRLDGPRLFQAQSLGWGDASEDQLEEWRLVWWFIYRLDAYVNLSSGTPYLIDERCVRTRLLGAQQLPDRHQEGQQGATQPDLYLPSRPSDLWRLVSAVTPGPPAALLPNLHVITSTATRQVGRALQLHMMMMMPPAEISPTLTEAEACITALRLSLPANYLNPTRNVFLEETRYDHHARLVTVLHLFVCRLLLAIISCAPLDEGDDEWLLNWQKVLEVCQDIASMAEQWNSTFSLSVDPAVCIIVFTALIFVDLHKKFTGVQASNTALHASLEHCEVILLLLLEQFAGAWTLPRLLILSFKSFQASTTGPLDRHHIQSILLRFESPLHPRWLEFLSSAQPDIETRLPGM